MTDPSSDYTTIHCRLFGQNYDLLYSAAAFQGEHLEVAINRACSLYEIMHRAQPGDTVRWRSGDGQLREVAILPIIIRPWWSRWLRKLLGVGISIGVG